MKLTAKICVPATSTLACHEHTRILTADIHSSVVVPGWFLNWSWKMGSSRALCRRCQRLPMPGRNRERAYSCGGLHITHTVRTTTVIGSIARLSRLSASPHSTY